MSPTVDKQRRQARSGAAVRASISKHPVFVMQKVNGWELGRSNALDHGMVYTQLDSMRVLINPETWTTLCASQESAAAFFAKFLRGEQASGLVDLTGIDWWSLALRAEAKKNGNDVVRARDEFEQLENELQRLITAASGFADGSTDLAHMQDFFSQLVIARGKLESYQGRTAQLESILDLAEIVVAALR